RLRPRRHGRARAAGDHREVRRRAGGARHDRRGGRRGRGDDRGGLRTVPRAERLPAAHLARAGGDAAGLPPLRLRAAGGRPAGPAAAAVAVLSAGTNDEGRAPTGARPSSFVPRRAPTAPAARAPAPCGAAARAEPHRRPSPRAPGAPTPTTTRSPPRRA